MVLLFVGMVTVLVTGEYDSENREKIEIIKENFETEVCNNMPKYPLEVSSAAGSIWKDGKLTICGGYNYPYYYSECYSLENGEWKLNSENMQNRRDAHAASNIGNAIWITGNGLQMSQKSQITLKI